MDTNTDYDTIDNNTQDNDIYVTEGTEDCPIKLLIDHVLSKLTQEDCIYSKDLVAKITDPSKKNT